VDPIKLFESRDATGALTTFTVGFGGDGLVLNYGTYYPPLGTARGREVDEYLVVPEADFPRLASVLGVPAADRSALLEAFAREAQRKSLLHLGTVAAFLASHGIRAEEPTPWYSYDD
jgi:hypothetical protein